MQKTLWNNKMWNNKNHGEQAESETSYQVSVPVTLVVYAKVNHKQPAVIFITQLSIIPFSWSSPAITGFEKLARLLVW